MIETKEVYSSLKEVIEIDKIFGWTEGEVKVRENGKDKHHYTIMSRDTEMPHYEELKQLEIEYGDAKNNIRQKKNIEFGVAFFLFLCLIIPGVIYVGMIHINNHKYEDSNALYEARMNEKIEEAKKIKE